MGKNEGALEVLFPERWMAGVQAGFGTLGLK